jgi:hypothetical protein
MQNNRIFKRSIQINNLLSMIIIINESKMITLIDIENCIQIQDMNYFNHASNIKRYKTAFTN